MPINFAVSGSTLTVTINGEQLPPYILTTQTPKYITTANTVSFFFADGRYMNNLAFTEVSFAGTAFSGTRTALEDQLNNMFIGNSNTGKVNTVLGTMLTTSCGNSIAGQSTYFGYYSRAGEVQLANMLAGSPMRFGRMTPGTRVDRHGCYEFAGKALSEILLDIDTTWFPVLQAAGIRPDLVLGQALLENDIAFGRTIAQMKSSLTAWIRRVQGNWPGVRIMLVTPRPSFSYNTTTKVTNYQVMRDYTLSLDNNSDIITVRGDANEDPASPAKPFSYAIIASKTGNILTVTSTTGPLAIGTCISLQDQTTLGVISSFGTGTGGTGTYNMSISSTVVSTAMLAALYTDTTVHPNARGALRVARIQAEGFKRIANVWRPNYINTLSANFAMEGSTAASGTNVTGTVPNLTGLSGATGGTFTVTAEDPGFLYSVTVAASTDGNIVDLGSMWIGPLALPNANQVSPFINIQIVSGAASLRMIEILPQTTDGGGSPFNNYISDQTNEADADYQNGDILNMRIPPLTPTSGTISSIIIYIKVKVKLSGGTISFRILTQGVGIIS